MGMTPPQLILLFATFLFGTVFGKVLISRISSKGKVEKRLEKYVEMNSEGKIEKSQIIVESNTLIQRVGKRIENIINLSKNEKLLLQSGIKLSLGEIFIARITVAVIGVMVGYLYGFPQL